MVRKKFNNFDSAFIYLLINIMILSQKIKSESPFARKNEQ